MSIVSCTYARSGDSCSGTHTFEREHTIQWLVQTNDWSHTPYYILQKGIRVGPNKLPEVYDEHPDDKYSYAKSGQCSRRSDDPELWDVTVKYDNKTTKDEQNKEQPVDRAPVYHIEWNQYQKVVQVDRFGKEIVNAAGERFDPPVTIEDCRPVLVVKKNMKTLIEVIRFSTYFKNAVNASSFYGAPTHNARIQAITCGEEQRQDDTRFYQVVVRIEFNDQSWDMSILNQGYRHWEYKYAAAQQGKRLVEAQDGGIPSGQPVNLTKEGFRIVADENDQVAEGNYLDFEVYPERDFSLLGI